MPTAGQVPWRYIPLATTLRKHQQRPKTCPAPAPAFLEQTPARNGCLSSPHRLEYNDGNIDAVLSHRRHLVPKTCAIRPSQTEVGHRRGPSSSDTVAVAVAFPPTRRPGCQPALLQSSDSEILSTPTTSDPLFAPAPNDSRGASNISERAGAGGFLLFQQQAISTHRSTDSVGETHPRLTIL
jgi:hypothetical protein